MSNRLTILICFALLVIVFFATKSCSDKALERLQQVSDRSKSVSDSLQKRIAVIDKNNDSMKAKNSHDSAAFVYQIDSQSAIIKSLQGKYVSSQNKIADLTNNLRTYYLSHDTVQLYRTYDSLQHELTALNNAYFAVQINRDSIEYYYKGEVDRLHSVINETQSNLSEFKKSFTDEVFLNKSLTDQIDKSVRKEKTAKLWNNVQKGLIAVIGFFIGKGFKK